MTTTIKVTSHNYPALVQTYDQVYEQIVGQAVGQYALAPPKLTDERVLRPEDGEQTFYCTTTRELRITDLEYDDPRLKPAAD